MIIGLVGFIGSGKGTAGDILEEHGYIKSSFAGNVKDVAAVMFHWKREYLEGDTEASRRFRETPDPYWSEKFGRPFTPREALQKVGTEVGRNIFDKDIWVHLFEKNIDKRKDYVITDVRFPNEIEWIYRNDGIVIEIQRGENPSWYESLFPIKNYTLRKILMNDYEVHESEWAWVGYTLGYVISNNSTKEDLTAKIESILTELSTIK